MVAYSRFNKVSAPRELSLDVLTSFATPVTTWTRPLVIRETEAVTYNFVVSDPKFETWLSHSSSNSLPLGSTLTCQQAGRGMLNCTFTWTPAEGQAGTFPLSIYVQSRNNDSSDSMAPIKPIYLTVQVLPKGS